MLKDHSEEELMQRLESGLEQPARPEHRLASLIPVLSFLEPDQLVESHLRQSCTRHRAISTPNPSCMGNKYRG